MIRSCLFIALRHLIARRRQSVLTILGLAVGVMVLISAISMMDGLKVSFIAQMLQVSPHITVKPDQVVPKPTYLLPPGPALTRLQMPDAPDEDTELTNYQAMVQAISADPAITTAAPELVVESFVTFGVLEQSVQIHGVVPEQQAKIGNLPDRLTAGSYQDFAATPDAMLMGYKLAERLTVGVGDRVRAVARGGRLMSFRVAGLLKTGMNSFDAGHAMIHLEQSQRLLGVPSDRATNINLRAADPGQVDAIARRLARVTGRKAETWMDENVNTLSMYTMISSVSYILTIFTMIVAGLGVSNVLTTVVIQKSLDVAVLLSMGYPRRAISIIFLTEGVALGTAGSLAGCLLGLIMTRLMAVVPMNFGDSAVMSITHLYMNQSVWYYVLSAAFGFFVSLVAGVAPARRAAKMDPIEIIRTEV
jgi:lipoprotein-releasing system permease protein